MRTAVKVSFIALAGMPGPCRRVKLGFQPGIQVRAAPALVILGRIDPVPHESYSSGGTAASIRCGPGSA